jgi:hypothetical protein
MKSLTNKLMVAAVAMAVVAGVASAQSMKAEVPFSFRVSGATMPAGTYVVTPGRNSTGIPTFRLLNTDVNLSVLSLPAAHHTPDARQMTESKLVFRCESGSCALAQIWTGRESGAYDLHAPKTTRQEAALISIAATKGE